MHHLVQLLIPMMHFIVLIQKSLSVIESLKIKTETNDANIVFLCAYYKNRYDKTENQAYIPYMLL